MSGRTAILIGAGPAGLTAAYELLQRTDVRPIVLEATRSIGGISQTVVHNGNRIDIGGHRFFSKSDRVMKWWLDRMPLEKTEGAHLAYQGQSAELPPTEGPDRDSTDHVMLLRPRKSRIYYLGRFFDYPISLTPDTVRKLGLRRTGRIGVSYAKASLRPREEKSLEDFLINRFGRQLYLTFFKEYTEKVWGVPCDQISAAWGAQRIKGLNLKKAVEHFFKRLIPGSPADISQKQTETSLIEQFMYPKLGPGQMWETTARRIEEQGGEVLLGWKIVEVLAKGERVTGVVAVDGSGTRRTFEGDFVFSTMPMRDLVRALAPTAPAPAAVKEVSEGLLYRDFLTVGLLVDELKLADTVDGVRTPITDNWIYIQEPGVKVGRMQVFNNWSPYLVGAPGKTWIGLEYFCNEGDDVWTLPDPAMTELGIEEAARIGVLDRDRVRDSVVVRMPKSYPAYFGTYDRFDELRRWLDRFENLILIGRNGMHRYNNQDHSMLTAMVAVDNIAAGVTDKAALWAVNTEAEYHEEGESRRGA